MRTPVKDQPFDWVHRGLPEGKYAQEALAGTPPGGGDHRSTKTMSTCIESQAKRSRQEADCESRTVIRTPHLHLRWPASL
mmetsp:Transcript_139904/g.447470  ORF Transcript_139904/g.447470 Transcript_139904/m.447470 type:complete len:80 (-) Transcript_139904:94-333(-)